MKMVIACALALGMTATAVGARADSPDCCKGTTCSTASGAACSPICLDANGLSVAELASRLSAKLGVVVRVEGPSFQTLKLKLCASTPEAALSQIATALHARWYLAYVFGPEGQTSTHAGSEPAVTVTFSGAPTASAAFVTAAQAGGVLVADRPLTGKVSFHGKNVPVCMAMDAIAVASGLRWMPAYVLQTGPGSLVTRQSDRSLGGAADWLKVRPGSPGAHVQHSSPGSPSIAPAPGMIVTDPDAEMSRLEQESLRRQQLGEWVTIFTQETPRETHRAARDLRIRVETVIQKLESYPPQDRTLAAGLWHARYLRMVEDYKHLTPAQQKVVQPIMDAMKYFAVDSKG